MDTAADEYDPLYLKGIAYFNACEFFEAHEVWEDLWKNYSGALRLFYKGLIQAAVALHHFGNGNIRGARKVYGSSRGYLSQYGPTLRRPRRGKVSRGVRRVFCRSRRERRRVSENRVGSESDSGNLARSARRTAGD